MTRASRGSHSNQSISILLMYVRVSSRYASSIMDIVGCIESSPSGRQIFYFAVNLPCTHFANRNSIGWRAGKHSSRLRIFLTWTPATVSVLCTRSMETRNAIQSVGTPRTLPKNKRIFEKTHLALESREGHYPL